MKKKSGFTLVELLIVMAIMGILTTITVSQFVTAKKKARDVARKGDLDAVTKSLQMYFADFGEFPAATTDGKLRVIDNGKEKIVSWGEQFSDNSSDTYVYQSKLPKENSLTNSPYCYVVSENRKQFALFAMLENTTDNDCSMSNGHGIYLRCEGKEYCFSRVSPNIKVGDL